MRKFLIIAAAVCAIVLIVLLLIPYFLDVNHYRGQIQAELQSRLGRPVSLGKIHASVFPPSVVVNDVAIGEDPQFGTGAFAKAKELRVRVGLLALLRKNVDVKSLTLAEPVIELVRNKDGKWNYSTLGKSAVPAPAAQKPAPPTQKPSGAKPPAPEEAAQPSGPPQFQLGRLLIDDGRVHLVDRLNNYQNTFNNIDVALNNFAPDKKFDVEVSVSMDGGRKQRIQLAGNAGPLTSSEAIPPFSGTVDLSDVSLSDLYNVTQVAALQGYRGVVSGEIKANTEKGVLSAEGSVNVADPQIRTTKLGYPITVDFNVKDNLNSGLVQVQNGNIKLGPTPVSISGTMNTTAKPSQVDMRLTTQGASLSEIARLAAASGVAFNAGTNIKGTVNADISARGAMSNPALNGTVKATGMEITGGQVKQPVTLPELTMALTPSAISSSPFTAKTGSTQLDGQFTLKDYTSKSPMVNASMKTNNANLGELLSIAHAYGVSAVDGFTGSGSITLNLTAAGPMKNASAMVFSGNGALQSASLKMPSLTKPLNVRNANIRFSQNSMSLENVAASLADTNANGNLSVRNFASPQVQFALNLDKLDLAAMQQIIVPTGPPQQRAELHLIPRAYAQKTVSEPSMLAKAVGNGKVTIGSLTYDQLVLQNVSSNVTLDRGVIRLAPLTSVLYGGQQSGEIVLDTRPTPPAVSVSTKLQKVDANKLVSSMSSMKNTLYGLLAANANANFRAASGSNMAQSLNGKLTLDLSNGRIVGIDLLNQVAKVAQFLNPTGTSQQPFTDVAKLTGNFNVVNGVAQTNDLRAVLPGANVAANGTVNLVSNVLNMHVTAVLSKEMSQKVGGNNIGGFMQTALANSQGELIIPVLVTGTFEKPQVVPDVQQLAQMKLQQIVPSFGNPGNMTSGILGAVLGGNKKGGQQQQNGLGGIVGAIAGQQTPNQQNQQQQPASENQQDQNSQQQAQPQNQQQAQPNDPLGDLLNQVLQSGKKKQQQQQQAPPPKQP